MKIKLLDPLTRRDVPDQATLDKIKSLRIIAAEILDSGRPFGLFVENCQVDAADLRAQLLIIGSERVSHCSKQHAKAPTAYNAYWHDYYARSLSFRMNPRNDGSEFKTEEM